MYKRQGNSFILDKNGSKIKQLRSFSEELSSWEIDQTKPEKNKLETSDMSSIFDALVLGVKDYAKKCGFKTALVGLSGGIDSALVSAIATAALGSENVYCVSMPSKWSSSHSKSDAKDLAKRLKISFKSIRIEKLMTSFEESFIKTIDFKMAEITNQNIQSRIRGLSLIHI